MVYITGDCHAKFNKFSTENFPEQREMNKSDVVMICGDFGGVWCDTPEERYWLEWLDSKSFTTVFCDGNHENFDRLYNEFPVVDFHGGKAHKIRDNIYHLMRGNIFDFDGKKFFVFGGAKSHDIKDGILDPAAYDNQRRLVSDYKRRTLMGEMLRIKGISWWEQELPSEDEMRLGEMNLSNVDYKVDYVISHCLPQSVASLAGFHGHDKMTVYFENLIAGGLEFRQWCCGHYHIEAKLLGKYEIYYNNVKRLL